PIFAEVPTSTLFAQVFSPAGAMLSGPIQVKESPPQTTQYTFKSVTALTNGNFLVTYGLNALGGGAFALAKVFGADGGPIGDEFQFGPPLTVPRIDNSDPLTSPGAIIALAHGGFMRTWEETDTPFAGSGQLKLIAQVSGVGQFQYATGNFG